MCEDHGVSYDARSFEICYTLEEKIPWNLRIHTPGKGKSSSKPSFSGSTVGGRMCKTL